MCGVFGTGTGTGTGVYVVCGVLDTGTGVYGVCGVLDTGVYAVCSMLDTCTGTGTGMGMCCELETARWQPLCTCALAATVTGAGCCEGYRGDSLCTARDSPCTAPMEGEG